MFFLKILTFRSEEWNLLLLLLLLLISLLLLLLCYYYYYWYFYYFELALKRLYIYSQDPRNFSWITMIVNPTMAIILNEHTIDFFSGYVTDMFLFFIFLFLFLCQRYHLFFSHNWLIFWHAFLVCTELFHRFFISVETMCLNKEQPHAVCLCIFGVKDLCGLLPNVYIF